MNDDQTPTADDPSLLIAEYVLGVLDEQDRRRVETLIAGEPKWQAELAAWQEHFGHWLERLPAAQPPEGVWQSIEQRLFAAPPTPSPQRLWWNDVRLWRGATAALAIALVLAVFNLQAPPPVPAATLLARLEQSDGTTLFAATVRRTEGDVLFVPTRTGDWPGRSAQAWVIGADGKPRSLGLLPANAATALRVAPDLAEMLASGALLAVSLEPPAGSPTGLPTGPIIAQGKILSL